MYPLYLVDVKMMLLVTYEISKYIMSYPLRFTTFRLPLPMQHIIRVHNQPEFSDDYINSRPILNICSI